MKRWKIKISEIYILKMCMHTICRCVVCLLLVVIASQLLQWQWCPCQRFGSTLFQSLSSSVCFPPITHRYSLIDWLHLASSTFILSTFSCTSAILLLNSSYMCVCVYVCIKILWNDTFTISRWASCSFNFRCRVSDDWNCSTSDWEKSPLVETTCIRNIA